MTSYEDSFFEQKSLKRRIVSGFRTASICFGCGAAVGMLLIFIGAALGFLVINPGIYGYSVDIIYGALLYGIPAGFISFLFGFLGEPLRPADNSKPE